MGPLGQVAAVAVSQLVVRLDQAESRSSAFPGRRRWLGSTIVEVRGRAMQRATFVDIEVR